MLNKKNRITNRSLIDKLFRKGKTFKGECLTFKFLPAKEREHRFAIVISKKISKKAVERNTFKRQISEALKKHFEDFKSPLIAMVILKSADINYADLEADIANFANQTTFYAE